MARVCEICGKGPAYGNSVSHSNRRTRKRWLPNIQTVKAAAPDGNKMRVKVCTRCLKSGAVSK